MIHDFLSFYIVVSKCEEWKEEALFTLFLQFSDFGV